MNNSVEIKLSDEGTNLYIFFGGIAAGITMPPFEFYNASGILEEHKIFIRDFNQNWYQCGLLDLTKDVRSTADFIHIKIKEIKPQKVYFVGNSMGGWAAILFAHLIGIGEVIAFAPQTFISPFLRLKHRDNRWKRQILKTYLKRLFLKKILDLKPLILNSKVNIKISIFVCNLDKLDNIHASHLKNIKNVIVHEFSEGGHSVVKFLKDEGKLPEIMTGNYIQ